MIARRLYTSLYFCLLVTGLGNCADADVVTSFQSAFQVPTPAAGWEYLWNNGGSIGNPANYTALLPNAGGAYTSGGANSLPTAAPAGSVNFAFVGGIPGGHPGLGTMQSGSDSIERYAIAAFTVTSSDLISIKNSSLITTNPNFGGSSDGLSVKVFINNNATPTASANTAPGVGSTATFDVHLGALVAGDKIYVAVGGRNEDLFDSFQLNYEIVAVPEPTSMILSGISITFLLSRTLLRQRFNPRGN
jgi:hypothetical protein